MTRPYIPIAGQDIGEAFPPLVIAEIRANHEGSLKTAFEMVDAAKASAAEMIKLPTHVAEHEIRGAVSRAIAMEKIQSSLFGDGRGAELFPKIINTVTFCLRNKQKYFVDVKFQL